MAIATGTALGIGAGLSALGSYMGSRTANRNARRQSSYNAQQSDWLRSLMTQGPGNAEQQIMGMFGANGQVPMGQGFNTGQDALMQMLRSDPRTKVDETLEGITNAQGNPFDTSKLFESLGVLDRRAVDESVAGMRAGAGGLGQRFGSATLRAEGDLRGEALENAAARNAQIAMGSHESAQQRLLSALGLLGGREQAAAGNRLNAAQLLQQGGLGAAGNQAQLLQLLLGAEQGRRGMNTQLAMGASQVGSPVFGPGYGGTVGSIGSLMMLPWMQQQMAATRGGTSG